MPGQQRDSIQRLRDRFYPPGTPLRGDDGTARFYDFVRSAAGPSRSALNLGAGPTSNPAGLLRGMFARHAGVDIDDRVRNNLDLDEAHVIDGETLPFREAEFDLVYADWTMEHVRNPRTLVREVFRVLRPNGAFTFRTPNLAHYVGIVAWSTPQSFHEYVGRHLRSSVIPDPYPTFYRCNTSRKARRMLSTAGFEGVQVDLLEPEPSYLAFSAVAFLAGTAYERLVNRIDSFASLRRVIIARGSKPPTDHSQARREALQSNAT